MSRNGSRVTRREALYITEDGPSTEDESDALRRLDRGSRDVTGLTKTKGKLEGKEVHPEILDVLPVPSNIANFSEAVSGEMIGVPELI